MKGENIICFAKDYDEAATSNHYVMRELARHNRVLWLDSVATRRPRLDSGRDLRKMASKLARFARGPRPVHGAVGMWRYTPLVLPLPHHPLATALNRQLLQATVWSLRQKLGMQRYQLWTFLPNVVDYIGNLGESLLVYYCVDEWSLFGGIDRRAMADADRRLCRKADIVFAVTDTLLEARSALNPNTHLAPHGVDHALFSRALDRQAPLPADVASLRAPIIGYFGSLEAWTDLDLIAFVAARHPDWNIVLIGPELVDTSRLHGFSNVHLLGRRAHAELPDYCRAFSVALMPFRPEQRMRYINPIKLREYLSAGLPVVSTPFPELERYRTHCEVADCYPAFEAAIERALAADNPASRRARSEAMQHETWAARIRAVGEQVKNTMENKFRWQPTPDIAPA